MASFLVIFYVFALLFLFTKSIYIKSANKCTLFKKKMWWWKPRCTDTYEGINCWKRTQKHSKNGFGFLPVCLTPALNYPGCRRVEHRPPELNIGCHWRGLRYINSRGQHSISLLWHVEDNLLLAHRGHGPVQHQLPPLWRAQVLVSMAQWVINGVGRRKKTPWLRLNRLHLVLLHKSSF